MVGGKKHTDSHAQLTRHVGEARGFGDADKSVDALKGIHRSTSIQVPADAGGVAVRKMLTDTQQIHPKQTPAIANSPDRA